MEKTPEFKEVLLVYDSAMYNISSATFFIEKTWQAGSTSFSRVFRLNRFLLLAFSNIYKNWASVKRQLKFKYNR